MVEKLTQPVRFVAGNTSAWRATIMACIASIVTLIGSVGLTLARGGLHWDQEMALFPWLSQQGWVLYRDIKDQHPPLLPAALSLLPGAGLPAGELAVCVGLVVLSLGLVAVAGWRLGGPLCGLVAVLFSACWELVLGQAHLWYDLAMAPFYLLALIIARETIRTARPILFFILGTVLGIALLVKQHAAVALLAGVLLVFAAQNRPRLVPDMQEDAEAPSERGSRILNLGLYVAGALLPSAITLTIFASSGAAGEYVYWVWVYNLTGTYATEGRADVPADQWGLLVELYLPFIALLLVWLTALLNRTLRSTRDLPLALFYVGLVVAATLPVWPRYALFHLAAAVPLLGIGAGAVAAYLVSQLRTWRTTFAQPEYKGSRLWLNMSLWVVAATLVVISLLVGGRLGGRWARDTWRVPTPAEPYSSTIQPLKDWVQSQTSQRDPIIVYDLDPTLYRVLDRTPTKPWTPLFPWIMRGDGVVEDWLGGMAAARPAIALVTPQFVTVDNDFLRVDDGRSSTFLLKEYHSGPHFTIRKYPDSPAQDVVGLVRNTP